MIYAGILRRLVACLVDVIPIIVLVTVAYFVLLGIYPTGASTSVESETTLAVLGDRGRIRDGSLVVWVLYATVLEASALQGTLGKRWLGIKVVDESGARLSLGKSMARNLSKILSLLPLGLGFVWALFRKDRRTWHDMIARTYVIRLQAWD